MFSSFVAIPTEADERNIIGVALFIASIRASASMDSLTASTKNFSDKAQFGGDVAEEQYFFADGRGIRLGDGTLVLPCRREIP